MKENNNQIYQCDYCKKEVLLSSAYTPEGMDYIYHFCGPDCFEKWKKLESGET